MTILQPPSPLGQGGYFINLILYLTATLTLTGENGQIFSLNYVIENPRDYNPTQDQCFYGIGLDPVQTTCDDPTIYVDTIDQFNAFQFLNLTVVDHTRGTVLTTTNNNPGPLSGYSLAIDGTANITIFFNVTDITRIQYCPADYSPPMDDDIGNQNVLSVFVGCADMFNDGTSDGYTGTAEGCGSMWGVSCYDCDPVEYSIYQTYSGMVQTGPMFYNEVFYKAGCPENFDICYGTCS